MAQTSSMWAQTWKLENETAVLRSRLYMIERNRQARKDYGEAKRMLRQTTLVYRLAAGAARLLFRFTVWIGLAVWNYIK